MQEETALQLDTLFKKEVYEGLTAFPKYLSSKFFYDKKGDKLFQDIMAMPSYYLTDAEFAILESNKAAISALFADHGKPFNLIELGAGDGKKTKLLLRHLTAQKLPFTYTPIDISQNALDQLKTTIKEEIPEVNIAPLQGTYFEMLETLNGLQQTKKAILFLGSNIGNLLHPKAIEFLSGLENLMQDEDLLFIGFDQKKNPQTVLDAYNDPEGITAAFNKNVLVRANTELNANFDIDQFLHWEVYDPETGTAKSYLVSKKAQEVRIDAIHLTVQFKAWETIHTEISQKYDDDTVAWLANQAKLDIVTSYATADGYYKNYVFKKTQS